MCNGDVYISCPIWTCHGQFRESGNIIAEVKGEESRDTPMLPLTSRKGSPDEGGYNKHSPPFHSPFSIYSHSQCRLYQNSSLMSLETQSLPVSNTYSTILTSSGSSHRSWRCQRYHYRSDFAKQLVHRRLQPAASADVQTMSPPPGNPPREVFGPVRTRWGIGLIVRSGPFFMV